MSKVQEVKQVGKDHPAEVIGGGLYGALLAVLLAFGVEGKLAAGLAVLGAALPGIITALRVRSGL